MNDKTGGPAFPRPMAETSLGGNFGQEGMTLRDWFAGMAMQGLCASHSCANGSVVREAYLLADAMLKAREAK